MQLIVARGINVLRRMLLRLGSNFLPHDSIDGIELVLLFPGEPDTFFAKTRLALSLIRERDRRRYHRITQDLRRIALAKVGGEYYDIGIRTYVMDLSCLQARSPIDIALTIVHESTHARLRKCGIQTTKENRSRVEHVCLGQESAFAARCPDAAELLQRIEAKKRDPWWAESQVADRYDQYLRGLGLPTWFIRARRRLLH
jgi:hypothetical protein